MYRINIQTSNTVEFPEITNEVQHAVDTSGIKEGVCYIFVPHTTAAITVNEHADSSVIEDIAVALEKLVPRLGNYRHGEGNSPAHIKASLFGSSQVIFIEKGKLLLGTWQSIFFCEFDGPRSRSVLLRILSG
jgi:secondary thiamine-phosphate synthase enzyme